MLHNEARKLLIQALEKTHNAREVAENFSVNRGTVYRLKRQLEETGSIETRTYLRGRKSALSREDIRNIEQLLKEKAAPESLIGLLEKQSSVQTEIETERTPDEDELGEYGAVQNLKHREKKLDESFQEGLEGQKTVTPRLRYTCSESNQEEKAFLKAQYFGKCQICGKQILQANGKVYFEACNILPTDVVPARYKQSISEGWNSLCLCPNCAAEFKFGKKNLSGLISMIQNYHVKERDENLIVCDIEMQGEKRSIKYTGKHFLALQRAVSFYETDMNSSTK